MLKDFKFTLLTLFWGSNGYVISNWLLLFWLVISPAINLGPLINNLISTLSSCAALTSSLFYSSIGKWAKCNNTRILQGYGIKLVYVYLTIFFVTFISILPEIIFLIINNHFEFCFIAVIFELFSYFSLLTSSIYTSKKNKSVKTLMMLYVFIKFAVVVQLTLYSKEATMKYSLFYLIGQMELWKISIVDIFIASLISIGIVYKSKKIKDIDWNKWRK